jgi:kynurenine formamidase
MDSKQATLAATLDSIVGAKKIIDLSVIIDQFYPAFQQESQEFLMIPQNVPGPNPQGYRGPGYEVIMIHDDHTGTHCDSPSHQVPSVESGLPNAGPMSKVTVEQLEPRQMMGPACVIDCTDLLKQVDRSKMLSPIITREKVEAWEQQHGPLQKDDIVLFRTDWTDLYYKQFPEGLLFTRHHPSPNGRTVEYLVKKGVKLVGVDTLGLGMFQDDYEPHLVAMHAGMIIVEKLIHLSELPPRGAYFIFLPIKTKGAGGGLGRAIAIV